MTTATTLNKYGVKETAEILRFVGAFASVTGEVAADGKVSLLELTRYVQLWPLIAPAVENFRASAQESLDLTTDERAELKAVFSEALKLEKPMAEDIFEEGLDVSLHLIQFVAKIRAARAAGQTA